MAVDRIKAARTFLTAREEMKNRNERTEKSMELLIAFGVDYRWLTDEEQALVDRAICLNLLLDDEQIEEMLRDAEQILDQGNFAAEAATRLAGSIKSIFTEEK